MKSDRKKRLTRLAAVFLVLFALYVCFGVWGVPAILKSQLQSKGSEALGRELSLARATFNPFTLETRLYELSVAGEASGELLSIERVSVNPQIISVLGDVILKSVEVSDATFSATIEPSGRLAFQDVIDHLSSLGASEPQEEEDDSEFGIRVERLNIERFAVNFEDRSLASPYSERLVLESLRGNRIGTLRIEDLDTDPETRYHWDFDGLLTIGSGGELSLSGGALGISPWIVELRTALSGFPIASVQPYLSERVLAELVGAFGFDIRSTVDLTDMASPKLLASGSVHLDTFSLKDDEREYLAFERLSIDEIDADLSSLAVQVGSATIQAPVVNAGLDETGQLILPTFAQDSEAEEASDDLEGLRFAFELDSFKLANGQIAVSDHSLESPFETRIQNLELAVNEVKLSQSDGPLEGQAGFDLALEVLGGAVAARSDVISLARGGEVVLDVSDLQLSLVQPYVNSLAYAEVQGGRFSTRLAVVVSPDLSLRVTGGSELAELRVAQQSGNERELVEFALLKIDGIEWNGESLTVDSVGLSEPKLSVWQDENGLNLGRLAKGSEVSPEKDGDSAAEVTASISLPVTIKAFTLENGQFEYLDTTLVSPYRTRLSEIKFATNGVTTDPEKVADFEFGFHVDGGGRVSGSGRVNAGNPTEEADLQLRVDGYDMTGLSPYWETYLARRLAKGQFAIVSNYEVRGNQLSGNNDFRIEELTLGERVESESAITGLPVGFAIKLLQGPDGVITYDGLKVQGDLSEPEVSVTGLIGKAIGNLIAKAATSPFKFLAGMVGGREDLDRISFEVGSIELSADAVEKVKALAKILESRPGLRLEITANPSISEERVYLKRRYVAHTIANPDFSPMSGLDLLNPYDQLAFQEGVSYAYRLATAEDSETTAQEAVQIASEASETPVGPPAEGDAQRKKGLVARISRFLGFGEKGNDEKVAKKSESTEGAAQEEAVPADANGVDSAEDDSKSDEEMLSYLVERYSDDVVRKQWIEDFSAGRIQAFKTQLFAHEGVDGSRVFVSNIASESSELDGSGDLALKLTE